LSAVADSRETSTDEIFAHQVRLQLIAHKITELADTSEGPRAALPFYLKAFRSQVLEMQQSLSTEAFHNGKSRHSFLYTTN
jgi:hypothetical protein